MMNATDELHLHLYGVLPPEKLWELSRDRPRLETRVAWYKEEYQKIFKSPSRFDDFWKGSSGLELFTEEYLFKKGGSFAHFQANINLAIALYPLRVDEAPLLDASCEHMLQQGIKYAEFRVFLAPYLTTEQRLLYLSMLSKKCCELESYYAGAFIPRLVLSLPREEVVSSKLYLEVKQWQTLKPSLAPYIVGLDFSGTEYDAPPSTKKSLMKRLLSDNSAKPSQALAVLYHVGETFEQLTPHNVLRWIWESADLGVHRLGHCSALGYPHELLIGKNFAQSEIETAIYQQWIYEKKQLLREYGYEYSAITTFTTYDRESAENFRSLQQAVRAYIGDRKIVIETCPTSNYLIGNTERYDQIPAVRLLSGNDLQVIISSDDPGIFATSLPQEYALCQQIGISPQRLQACSDLAQASHAENLVGHPF